MSSTLYALPSKEWVVPSRPKPGRKPKKDDSDQPVDPNDEKAKKVQNRAAQRAFRERKQSQLAELQARINQYEHGEIERNVAFQNLAKRLKEENDTLRAENSGLKEENDLLRVELRKRDGEPIPSSSSTGQKRPSIAEPDSSSRKRSRPNRNGAAARRQSISSSNSSAGSSTSGFTGFNYSDMSASTSSPLSSSSTSISSVVPQKDNVQHQAKVGIYDPSLEVIDCGFCADSNTPCICREFPHAINGIIHPRTQGHMDDAIEKAATDSVHGAKPSVSILDNLPAYQAAVSLRRRTSRPTGSATGTLFPFASPSNEADSNVAPTCSGDPRNCLACADDPANQAFCAAISDAVTAGVCEQDDPSAKFESPNSGMLIDSGPNPLCCGDPKLCGGGCGVPSAIQPLPSFSTMTSDAGLMEADLSRDAPDYTRPGPSNASSSQSNTAPPALQTSMIPCNSAWAQLKSHPNIAFADLTLLADVVARRSKCSGPNVTINPEPGTVTPERQLTPAPPDHRADGHDLRLVSEETLIRSGRKRVMEVQKEGVRDALAMLDGTSRLAVGSFPRRA